MSWPGRHRVCQPALDKHVRFVKGPTRVKGEIALAVSGRRRLMTEFWRLEKDLWESEKPTMD